MERTSAVVKGLKVVLEHHSAPKTVVDEMESDLHRYADDAPSEGVWLKRMKYALAAPLARYLGNELPPAADVPLTFSRRLRGWMQARGRPACFNRRNTHLWYSWLQAKRCALPVSDDMVDKSYVDHQELLTSEDPLTAPMVHGFLSEPTMDRLLQKLHRAFKRAGPETMDEFCHTRTTISACWERTRSQGGQVGALCGEVGLPTELLGTELVAMRWYPVVHTTWGETLYNQVIEVRRPCGYEEWAGLKDLLHDRVARDPELTLSCQIQAVLEPMKVRIISKGEALPYYGARPVQKWLHDTLRRMPCFRLIGRPFCPTDLVDLVNAKQSLNAVYEDLRWFSIDYSRATDGLSSLLGIEILRRIVCGTSPDSGGELAWKLLRSVLGRHEMLYAFSDGHTETTLQERGQLMGSILSFPILCLANLALYLNVTGQRGTNFHYGWTDKERLDAVLVNGDDMLYRAPLHAWDVHVRMGQSIGLEMSIGKAYHHPVYCNVNSTSVHYDPDDAGGVPKGTPWQIDYLNVGLLFGQHKVQGGTDRAAAHGATQNLGACSALDVVVRGCRTSTRLHDHQVHSTVRVVQRYLKERETEMRSEATDSRGRVRNYFVPQNLGGMGLTPPPGWRVRVTATQRRIAQRIVEDFSGGLARCSFGTPIPGNELEELSTLENVPWSKPGDSERTIFGTRCASGCLPRRFCLLGVRFFSPPPIRIDGSGGAGRRLPSRGGVLSRF